jgi:glutamate dehydrogenase/leucine dehydrogenase
VSAYVQGKRCLVSGSGNVAQYAALKLLDLGAVVLTMSDSHGYLFEPRGFSREQIHQIMDIKNNQRGRLESYKSDTGGRAGEEKCEGEGGSGQWWCEIKIVVWCDAVCLGSSHSLILGISALARSGRLMAVGPGQK